MNSNPAKLLEIDLTEVKRILRPEQEVLYLPANPMELLEGRTYTLRPTESSAISKIIGYTVPREVVCARAYKPASVGHKTASSGGLSVTIDFEVEETQPAFSIPVARYQNGLKVSGFVLNLKLFTEVVKAVVDKLANYNEPPKHFKHIFSNGSTCMAYNRKQMKPWFEGEVTKEMMRTGEMMFQEWKHEKPAHFKKKKDEAERRVDAQLAAELLDF